VVHIPRNLGSGETLNRTVAESFGIHDESYSVGLVEIRLCCGRVVFWV
jgi:hypothetical protein